MNAIEKGKAEIDNRSLNCFYAIAPNSAKDILEQTAKAFAIEELEKMRAEVIKRTEGLNSKEAAMIFTITSIDRRINQLKGE